MICPLKQSKLNKSQGLIPPAVEFFNLNKKVDSSIKRSKREASVYLSHLRQIENIRKHMTLCKNSTYI